ncbi:cilia- and flagella-associated protein 20, partial [Nephila pilipes]
MVKFGGNTTSQIVRFELDFFEIHRVRKITLNMFKNRIPSKLISILYSLEEKPLDIWDVKAEKGHVERVHDNDLKSLVIEIVGTHVCTTYINCPSDPQNTLGIRYPFLVLSIKNLKKPFALEIQ